jgi:ribose transport system permease protein
MTTTSDPVTAPVGRAMAGVRAAGRAEILRRVLPLAALIVMIIFFGIKSSSFLSPGNFTLMTGQAGILLLTALGATLVVIAGSVDLSVGSTILLTGAILAIFINHYGGSLFAAVLVTLALGVGIGLVNGVVFVYGKVPSFITTLGTLSLLSGIGLAILDGESITFNSDSVVNLAIGKAVPHVQNAALVAAGVFVIVWFLARRTRFGLYVYAIGGNEPVVRLAGVNVRRVKLFIMILSSLTAAIAGLLLAGQLSSGSPSLGSNSLLDSIAAIVVGGTALSGGIGGVERTLLGVLILTVLSDGLDQMGVNTFLQTGIKGAVIIIAAVFTMASRRRLLVIK